MGRRIAREGDPDGQDRSQASRSPQEQGQPRQASQRLRAAWARRPVPETRDGASAYEGSLAEVEGRETVSELSGCFGGRLAASDHHGDGLLDLEALHTSLAGVQVVAHQVGLRLGQFTVQEGVDGFQGPHALIERGLWRAMQP